MNPFEKRDRTWYTVRKQMTAVTVIVIVNIIGFLRDLCILFFTFNDIILRNDPQASQDCQRGPPQ